MKFCFATFVFGDRYYPVANRFIDDIIKSQFKPTLVVVTDRPDLIHQEDFVKTFDIRVLNKKYAYYATNYYGFDFSVERYAIKAALMLGYRKIVLTNAEMRVDCCFREEEIMTCFKENSILGPSTFDFNKEVTSSSKLGLRLREYEKLFGVEIDKSKLMKMPEDCIEYFQLTTEKYAAFLTDWDCCIEYKYTKPLSNIPIGNIDEICFCAVKNDINLGNNVDSSCRVVHAQHDRWYA
jgi:hypothetical protein